MPIAPNSAPDPRRLTLTRGFAWHARVRKAVFPVAGLGTRFLPATKAMPKEMLTVVDRPLIQHVVDEARGRHRAFHLRHRPQQGRDRGPFRPPVRARADARRARQDKPSSTMLDEDLPGPGSTSFTRQQEPLGLGHAVWCARELVGNEPFALLLPDMLVQTPGKGCLAQMIDAYDEHGGNVIAVEQVPQDQANHLRHRGRRLAKATGECFAINAMVEKPKPGTAPSNLTSSAATSSSRKSSSCFGAGARRRRRDPDHRRHDRAFEAAAVLRAEIRRQDLRLRRRRSVS